MEQAKVSIICAQHADGSAIRQSCSRTPKTKTICGKVDREVKTHPEEYEWVSDVALNIPPEND